MSGGNRLDWSAIEIVNLKVVVELLFVYFAYWVCQTLQGKSFLAIENQQLTVILHKASLDYKITAPG